MPNVISLNLFKSESFQVQTEAWFYTITWKEIQNHVYEVINTSTERYAVWFNCRGKPYSGYNYYHYVYVFWYSSFSVMLYHYQTNAINSSEVSNMCKKCIHCLRYVLYIQRYAVSEIFVCVSEVCYYSIWKCVSGVSWQCIKGLQLVHQLHAVLISHICCN